MIMMGQGSYVPPAGGNPAVCVVGQQFMIPYSIDLTIIPKMLTTSERNFAVTDANGILMFLAKRKSKLFSLHDPRILIDAAGNTILSIHRKIMSLHKRWKVYRGDSQDYGDLLFTVKKSSLLKSKTRFDVFLATNTSEHYCDFKIKDKLFEGSFSINVGDTSTVIAQMRWKVSLSSIVLEKDKFTVTVCPYVDHAFIVALFVILHCNAED